MKIQWGIRQTINHHDIVFRMAKRFSGYIKVAAVSRRHFLYAFLRFEFSVSLFAQFQVGVSVFVIQKWLGPQLRRLRFFAILSLSHCSFVFCVLAFVAALCFSFGFCVSVLRFSVSFQSRFTFRQHICYFISRFVLGVSPFRDGSSCFAVNLHLLAAI